MSLPTGSASQYAQVARDDIQINTDVAGRSDRAQKWAAPATMGTAFGVGLGLILAQHFVYVSLDGKAVSDVSVSQAWISRISTALAFAIKLALTISVGAAFVQHQWLRLNQSPFKVRELDALSSGLGNMYYLFASTVWFRHPLLAFIAIASWTIPLSAVVTPGALSVLPLPVMTSVGLQVPQLQFDNYTAYGAPSCCGSMTAGQMKEDKLVTKLAVSAASSGNPVQLQSVYQNQSYNMVFDGPAIKCASANKSITWHMTENFSMSNAGGAPTEFLAWVPGGSTYTYKEMSSNQTQSPTLDELSMDASRIFVMTNTGLWDVVLEVPSGIYAGNLTVVNVTECVLYNAVYNVDFVFKYPNQTRTVEITNWLNTVANPVTEELPTNGGLPASTVYSYAAVMSAFGRLLVGYSQTDQYGDVFNLATNWNIIDIDWSRSEAVQSGLEQLFQNITLSLLSDSTLIKNSSIAELVPVTVESWPISYVYTRTDLFIANGLSLLAAFVCCMIGIRAFWINHASYQNVFSTYLRATNGMQLDRFMDENDRGADSLPKAFGAVKIGFGDRGSLSDKFVAAQRYSQNYAAS